MLNPESSVPARPDTVTVASILWIVVGPLSVLLGVWILLQALVYGYLPTIVGSAIVLCVIAGFGIAFVNLSGSLRRGRDVRTTLTVLGVILCFLICPAFVVVPAIVLQYLPSSGRWFRACAPYPQ